MTARGYGGVPRGASRSKLRQIDSQVRAKLKTDACYWLALPVAARGQCLAVGVFIGRPRSSSRATERGQFAATVRAGQPKGCDFVSRLDMGRMRGWLVHEAADRE